MVLTRSASGVDVSPPPTPSRPRSSAGAPSTARKPSTRSRKALASSPSPPSPSSVSSSSSPSPSAAAATTTTTTTSTSTSTTPSFSHAPDNLTMLWLAVSLPLVIWDAGYILLRPHSMPGGALHWPLWQPYALYGEVDHVYGFKQWDAGDGFAGAQTMLNVAETTLYLAYIGLWARHGTNKNKNKKTTADKPGKPGSSYRTVGGRVGARAVLLLFAAAVMTLSKTVLYWLNEYFSGFANIGQNDAMSLVFLWIIPNGLWIVFPAIITYKVGSELVTALAGPSGSNTKKE